MNNPFMVAVDEVLESLPTAVRGWRSQYSASYGLLLSVLGTFKTNSLASLIGSKLSTGRLQNLFFWGLRRAFLLLTCASGKLAIANICYSSVKRLVSAGGEDPQAARQWQQYFASLCTTSFSGFQESTVAMGITT